MSSLLEAAKNMIVAIERTVPEAKRDAALASLKAGVAREEKRPLGLTIDPDKLEQVSGVLARVHRMAMTFQTSEEAFVLNAEDAKALSEALVTSQAMIAFLGATPAAQAADLLTAAAKLLIAEMLDALHPFASRHCKSMRAAGRYQSAHVAEGVLLRATELSAALRT